MYTPNLQDWRVRARLNRILSFSENFFVWNGCEARLHKNKKKIHFGQQQHNLTKYLESMLLTKVDTYVAKEKAYKYRFSWNNMLCMLLDSGILKQDELVECNVPQYIEYENFKPMNFAQYKAEHEAKTFIDFYSLTRNFSHLLFENAEYEVDEFTTRLTHPFQNKTKEARRKFWAGWYDYDIESCAYALIYQHYRNTVEPWWGKRKIKLVAFPQVSENKHAVRAMLVEKLDIDLDCAKTLLASLLFEPRITIHNSSKLYKMLLKKGYEPRIVLRQAMNDPFIQQLISELKSIWPKMMTYWNNSNDKIGRREFKEEYIDKSTGEIITKRFKKSRFRARIYFELERAVLDVIRDNMKGALCHLIYDGFFCPVKADVQKLIEDIKIRTGFDIKISEVQLRID